MGYERGLGEEREREREIARRVIIKYWCAIRPLIVQRLYMKKKREKSPLCSGWQALIGSGCKQLVELVIVCSPPIHHTAGRSMI